MTLDEAKIKKIAETIVKMTHPKKIYVFGSHAKGTARPESDLDLLIIAEMPGPKNKRSLAIRRLFPNRDFSLDVFVYHEDEYNEEVGIANTLATTVAREGKIIYDFAESLSGYAVEIRYPGDFFECSIEEAEEAVEMAKAFKNFVLRKLNN